MLMKKTSKFFVLLRLMILVNIARAEKDMDPLLKGILFGDGEKKINKNSDIKVIKLNVTVNFANTNSVIPNNILTKENLINLNKTIKISDGFSEASLTLTLPPICHTPGVQAHESDCRKYYNCSLLEGSQNGSFHLITQSCPPNQAFNNQLRRCSRDISSCALDIKCLDKGTIADPNNNNSFYLCEPRLIGSGFRIFHVNCGLYEVFYWGMGRCAVDLDYLPFHRSDQPRDIDAVKKEWKILMAQDKLKLKAEEKRQKENYPNIVRAAKKEAANFICVNKGYFPSKVGDKFYISCQQHNDKLKAISMECNVNGKFYPKFQACVYKYPSESNIFIDDEDY